MINKFSATGVFKKRFAESVKKSGRTQKEIAQGMDISEQAVSRYLSENSGQLPRLDMLIKMSDYFGVSIDYFAGKKMAKAPGNEAIMRRLGLTEQAIENLERMNEFGIITPQDSAIPSLVSALLETKPGRRILQRIALYAFSSTEVLFHGETGAGIGTSKIAFDVGKASPTDHKMTVSADDLIDALVIPIPAMLRDLRKIIQSGKYSAPFPGMDPGESGDQEHFE